MAYDKIRSDRILESHRTGGSSAGLRLLTADDSDPLTAGQALAYDANGKVVSSGGAAGNVTVAKAGTLIGTRSRINFIEGSNVTITAADDSGNDEIDVTIASSGGGGASGYAAILHDVYDWYASNNAADMDHKIDNDPYFALIHHDKNATSGFLSPSTALHTVTTGKKAVILRCVPAAVNILDPGFRGMRLRNTTDGSDVVPTGDFNASHGAPRVAGSDTAQLPEVAAGKDIELQTWNSSASDRGRGGFVIFKEVTA